MIEETNEELIRQYGEQITVLGKSLGELLKSISTRFVGLAMCTNSAIPKWCLRKVSGDRLIQ